MDPKKIAILVVLIVALVVVGRWACAKWKYYNPEPVPYGYGPYGMMYGYGAPGAKAKGPGAGKAPEGKAPANAKNPMDAIPME